MDLYPLFNSIRISIISTIIIFFLGIFFAYYVKKMPPFLKGLFDLVLTLPLVLPPTVLGFFIIKLLSPNSFLGIAAQKYFQVTLIMNWYSAIFACVLVAFPLMYRTTRGAFEDIDNNLIYAARSLGKSNTWIFWRIILPNSKKILSAGFILSFARALGEYGATSMVSGYIPRKTATIATTVYQSWVTGNDALAYKWVLINVVISMLVLLSINLIENKKEKNA